MSGLSLRRHALALAIASLVMLPPPALPQQATELEVKAAFTRGPERPRARWATALRTAWTTASTSTGLVSTFSAPPFTARTATSMVA